MADARFVGEFVDDQAIVSVNLSQVRFARWSGKELKIYFGGAESTPLILTDKAAARLRPHLALVPGTRKKKRPPN